MQFTQFVLFLLLASKNCLNGVKGSNISNDCNFASLNHQLQYENGNVNKKGKNGINFMDLNTDVYYEMLDSMNMDDLMNMMEAIPQLSPFGVSIYQKRYKDVIVTIRGALITKNPGMDFLKFGNSPELCFKTQEVILKVLKHFGCVIQRLYVESRLISHSIVETININQYINKYTSASLVHLDLNEIDYEIIDQFTVPFRNVESLNFTVLIDMRTISTRNITLNDLFPKLKKLKMELWADIDYSFIVCELPQLQHLTLHIYNWKRQHQFDSLIRKNPQIGSIDVRYSPLDYIKFISEQLPNVENLTLFEVNISGNDTVQIENVKYFSYTFPDALDDTYSFEKFSFPHLNSLKLQNDYNNFAQFVSRCDEFFRKHSNIIKLHYVIYLPCDNLLALELTLPNLVEIVFECTYYTDADKVIEFLGKHEKLRKFEMKCANGTINIEEPNV